MWQYLWWKKLSGILTCYLIKYILIIIAFILELKQNQKMLLSKTREIGHSLYEDHVDQKNVKYKLKIGDQVRISETKQEVNKRRALHLYIDSKPMMEKNSKDVF